MINTTEQLQNHLNELENKVRNMQHDVQNVITKVDMLNPPLFLEFKGTLVETLKTFDRDIEDIKKALQIAKEQMIIASEKRDIARAIIIEEIKQDIKKLAVVQAEDHTTLFMTKSKMAVYIGIVSMVTVTIMEFVLHLFIK